MSFLSRTLLNGVARSTLNRNLLTNGTRPMGLCGWGRSMALISNPTTNLARTNPYQYRSYSDASSSGPEPATSVHGSVASLDAFLNASNTSTKDAITIYGPKQDKSGRLLFLEITDRASKRLNTIAQDDKRDDLVLRVSVESGGCHGFQYLLGLEDLAKIDLVEDSMFEKDGARVAIDQTSLGILRDSKIDYTSELIGSQFKVIDSPYTTSSCGCGSSFDFDDSKLN